MSNHVTTPTQPPDPRVERIAKALAANKLSLITSVALARVLVEELGGREATVREIETVAEPVQRVTWGYDGAITATHNGAVYVLTGPEGARFEHKNLDTLILNWPQAAPHRAALETLAAQAQPSGKAGELDTRARVLVEELGAREMHRHAEYASYAELTERNATQERRIIAIHAAIDDALGNGEWRGTTSKEYVVGDAEVIAIRTLAAQQRENAETIAALKERVETAERNAGVADKNYEGLFRASKEMEDDNKRLRAELDAIKGAQPSVQFESDGWPNPMTITHDGEHFVVRSAKSSVWFYDTYNELLKQWRSAEPQRATIMTLRHPAPAQPVVVLGEVFVFPVAGVKHVSTRWIAPWDSLPEGRYEFTLGAPLSTEGGK